MREILNKVIKNAKLFERLSPGIIIFVALLSRIIAYRIPVPQNTGDPSIYIAMGKYLYSLGKVGFWETRRSILLPLILGFFWKLGFDPVLFGNIIEILFSIGSIFLVYVISKHVFNKRVGLLAAIFLSISHIYFTMGAYIMPRIPATFFSLLAVYCFLNNGQRISGLFSALAILAHISLFPLYGFLFLFPILRADDRMHTYKNMINFLLGSLLAFLPFFLSNIIVYKSPFFPIVEAYSQITREQFGWGGGPPHFYLENIFLKKEPIILLLYLIGIILIIRKPDAAKVLILSIGTVFLLSIHTHTNQSLRYIIPSLPYLHMVGAYAFFQIYDYIKHRKRCAGLNLFILLCIYITFSYTSTIYTQLKATYTRRDLNIVSTFIIKGALIDGLKYILIRDPNIDLDPYQQYVRQNEKAIQGSIWISDGDALIYSNLKASKLMWHPVLKLEQVIQLQKELPTADWIFLNLTTLSCFPTCKYSIDEKCAQELKKFTETIISQFKAERYFTNSKGEFIGGIFKRSP